MKMIVRQWVDIRPEWEFRCFVYGGKMTAITQYYYFAYVPALAANRGRIAEHILVKFELVKHLIPIPEFDLEKTWIVEINHTPPQAGTGLFKWEDPADRKLIEQGPLEIRVLDSVYPNVQDILHPPIMRMLKDGFQRLRLFTLQIIRGEREADPSGYSCNHCYRRPIAQAGETWWQNTLTGEDRCLPCHHKLPPLGPENEKEWVTLLAKPAAPHQEQQHELVQTEESENSGCLLL